MRRKMRAEINFFSYIFIMFTFVTTIIKCHTFPLIEQKKTEKKNRSHELKTTHTQKYFKKLIQKAFPE